jgi:hypothetical protein
MFILLGFIEQNNFTMHGPMKVKFPIHLASQIFSPKIP